MAGVLKARVGGAWQPILWGGGGGGGAGDVVGPGSALDTQVARFSGATGKLIKASNVVIDDAGVLVAAGLGGTPLNATSLTSGTVPDARLPANLARTTVNNNFTVPQDVNGGSTQLTLYSGAGAGTAGLMLKRIDGPVDQKLIGFYSDGTSFFINGYTDAFASTRLLTLERSGDLTVTRSLISNDALWVTSATPHITLTDNNQAANQRVIRLVNDGGKIDIFALNDGMGVVNTLLEVDRGGGDAGVGFRDLYVTRNLMAQGARFNGGYAQFYLKGSSDPHGLAPRWVNSEGSANQKDWRILMNPSGDLFASPYDDSGTYLGFGWLAHRNGDFEIGGKALFGNFSSTVFNAWNFNSTFTSGGYITTQHGGTAVLQMGNATAMSIGASDDACIKAMASVLFIEAATAIKSVTIYTATTANVANVYVASDGQLSRSTSSLRYKDAVLPMTDWRWLLDVQPITFVEKKNPTGRRFGGLAAEDVAALAPMFAGFNPDGEPDEVAYGHLTAPIICALKDIVARLDRAGLW